MPSEHLLYDVLDDHIAVVTLNRPAQLNALNPALMSELADAVATIERDEAIRVWMLTGAPRPDGRPNFCAGVDLSFRDDPNERHDPGFGRHLTSRIDDMLKPSIAVIDGVCTTGGAESAVACDLRVVGEAAQISDWHLKNLGNGIGGWGASTRWSRLVGAAKAKEIFLTGKVIGAVEAVQCGFATSEHPSAELFDEAIGLARSIATMDPAGVRMTLAHIDHTRDMSRDEALRWGDTVRSWLGPSRPD